MLQYFNGKAIRAAEDEKAKKEFFESHSQKRCSKADLAGNGNPYDTDALGLPCDVVAIGTQSK